MFSRSILRHSSLPTARLGLLNSSPRFPIKLFSRSRSEWSRKLGLNLTPEEKAALRKAKMDRHDEIMNSMPMTQAANVLTNQKPEQWKTPNLLTDPMMASQLIPAGSDSLVFRNLLDESVSFPEVFHGRCSLLSFAYNGHSFAVASTWSNYLLEQFPNDPLVQTFQFSLVNSFIVRTFFAGVTKKNFKAKQPESRHASLFAILDGAELKSLHKSLKQWKLNEQQIVSHIFLIDHEGKVRWRAYGKPDSAELEILKNCVQQLTEKIKSIHPAKLMKK